MRLVFTCGCFDLFHAGHALLLEKARGLGDMLVVGVNSDSSIAALKGEDRPIQRLCDRMAVLRSIRWVDAVIPFHDLTAENLVRSIRPDVIVKGNGANWENTPEARVAAEWAGQFVIVRGTDVSTTVLIERMRGAA